MNMRYRSHVSLIASQNTGTWLFVQKICQAWKNEIVKTPYHCPFVRRMVDPRRKGPMMHDVIKISQQNFLRFNS